MTFFPILWRKSVLCPASASAASRRRSLSFLLAMDCRKCSKPAVRRTVQKNNANHGREFITCSNAAGGCKYFEWVDGKPSNVGAAARPVTSLAAKYSSDSAASAVPQANTLVVYTDGACIGNQNVQKKACPSGWGVVVVSQGGEQGPRQDEGVVLCELFGPVILDKASPYFMGATVGSNNTAELSAIGEALLWCSRHLRSTSSSVLKRVVIRYDSEYAAKSVQGIFNGKKNVELIGEVRKHYAALHNVIDVSFVHVKGHSKARWNDRADELAGYGAAGRICVEGRYSSGTESCGGGSGNDSTGSSSTNGSNVGSITETNIININTDDSKTELVTNSVANNSSQATGRKRPPILGQMRGSMRNALPDSRFSDSRSLGTIGPHTLHTSTSSAHRSVGEESIEVISLSSDDSGEEDDAEDGDLRASAQKKRKF